MARMVRSSKGNLSFRRKMENVTVGYSKHVASLKYSLVEIDKTFATIFDCETPLAQKLPSLSPLNALYPTKPLFHADP